MVSATGTDVEVSSGTDVEVSSEDLLQQYVKSSQQISTSNNELKKMFSL